MAKKYPFVELYENGAGRDLIRTGIVVTCRQYPILLWIKTFVCRVDRIVRTCWPLIFGSLFPFPIEVGEGEFEDVEGFAPQLACRVMQVG